MHLQMQACFSMPGCVHMECCGLMPVHSLVMEELQSIVYMGCILAMAINQWMLGHTLICPFFWFLDGSIP